MREHEGRREEENGDQGNDLRGQGERKSEKARKARMTDGMGRGEERERRQMRKRGRGKA